MDNVDSVSSVSAVPQQHSHENSVKTECDQDRHSSISTNNNSNDNGNNTNESDFDINFNLPPDNQKIGNELMQVFLQWYFKYSEYITKYYPYSQTCLNNLPKLIIIIDKIESWSPIMISSLIHTLHSMHQLFDPYINEINKNCQNELYKINNLPFILVMGVASTKRMLSLMIDSDAQQLLSTKFFKFENSCKV